MDNETKRDIKNDIKNSVGDLADRVYLEAAEDAAANTAAEGAVGAGVEVGLADELALFFVAAGAIALIFTLPWRMFRLARIAWRIEFESKSKHFRMLILSRIAIYVGFWLLTLGALAGIYVWFTNA